MYDAFFLAAANAFDHQKSKQIGGLSQIPYELRRPRFSSYVTAASELDNEFHVINHKSKQARGLGAINLKMEEISK